MAKSRRPYVVLAMSSQTITTVGMRKVNRPSGKSGMTLPMTGSDTDRVIE